MAEILVCDDDKDIVEAIEIYLKKEKKMANDNHLSLRYML